MANLTGGHVANCPPSRRCQRLGEGPSSHWQPRQVGREAVRLSELDFCRLTRRYRLPEPDRQVIRLDPAGRRRWLDAFWRRARLVAEVDGLWHMDPPAWWADMRRDNDLTISGHRVLRFPAFAVRDHPDLVAGQIAAALGLGGGSQHQQS